MERSNGNPLPVEVGGIGRWDNEGFYRPANDGGFGFVEIDDGEVVVYPGGRRLSIIPEELIARPTEERPQPRQLSAIEQPPNEGYPLRPLSPQVIELVYPLTELVEEDIRPEQSQQPQQRQQGEQS